MASKFDKLFEAENEKGFLSKDFKIPGVSDGEGEYNYILLDRIEINPANSYSKDDTEEELEILAEDIERNSLLHNIVVLDKGNGKYLILSGERRYKAYRLLREKHKEDVPNPYDTIYARIYRNLDEIEQQIMIDAANLQVRGAAASEEVKFRKGLMRFTDNLKLKFGFDDKEAVAIAQYQSGVSLSTIRRDVILERGLIPELIEYVDNGDISKEDGLAYARLSEESQRFVLSALSAAKAQDKVKQVSKETTQFAKNIADKEEAMADIDEKIEDEDSENKKRSARRKKQKLKKAIDAEKEHVNDIVENLEVEDNDGSHANGESSHEESALFEDNNKSNEIDRKILSEVSELSKTLSKTLGRVTAEYVQSLDEEDARELLKSVSDIIKTAKEAKIQIKYGLGEIKSYED